MLKKINKGNDVVKILLVIGGLSFGGAERVITNLANSLAKNGDEVILTGIFYKKPAYELDDRVTFINGINGGNTLISMVKLRKLMMKVNPDIVLTFLTHINIATLIAGIGLKIPIVISERNDPIKTPKEKTRRILRKLIYPLADGYVFQTKEAMTFFGDKFIDKSTIIPNPLYIDNSLSKNWDSLPKIKRLISVGRLVPQKRHDQVISVFKEILNELKDNNYILEIWGSGPEMDNLLNLIKELNLENNVFLMGESKEIHLEMSKAELFIMYSKFEGMPNSLMEAMALGLPVISSDCESGGPRFLIDNDENGILTPLDDIVQLKKNIISLLENRKHRINLGLNAKEISIKLNSDKINSQWRNYLLNLINEKKNNEDI